ncbi:MAG: hypothetical protein JWN72_41 [Thermoleophilia bacterium]|nr:hypothetical protein [Thermoleophilia bacterium]
MSFITGVGHQWTRNFVLQPIWGNDTKATDKGTRIGEGTMDVLNMVGGLSSIAATRAGAGGVILALHSIGAGVAGGMNLFGHAHAAANPKNPLFV